MKNSDWRTDELNDYVSNMALEERLPLERRMKLVHRLGEGLGNTTILTYVPTPYHFAERQLDEIIKYDDNFEGKVLCYNFEHIELLRSLKKYSNYDLDLHLYTDDNYVIENVEKHMDDVTIIYDPNPMEDFFGFIYEEKKVRTTNRLGKTIDKTITRVKPNMKFDYVVGNPPYNSNHNEGIKSKQLWPDFVEKSFEITKDGGYVSLVHPGGWRAPKGRYENCKKLLFGYDTKYISMHNFQDGMEMFGVGTSYDWYVSRKTKTFNTQTLVEFQDGTKETINLSNFAFLPNGSWEQISSLIAEKEEESVSLIHERSSYGSDKAHMNKEKTETHTYPCVYTITQKDGITLRWSSTNKNGMFGAPKVIWSNGEGTYPVVDEQGTYGLTQFAYAIEDEPDNLDFIALAMDSDEFRSIMDDCRFTNNPYSHKVIELLRKDFWKEFI